MDCLLLLVIEENSTTGSRRDRHKVCVILCLYYLSVQRTNNWGTVKSVGDMQKISPHLCVPVSVTTNYL